MSKILFLIINLLSFLEYLITIIGFFYNYIGYKILIKINTIFFFKLLILIS